jgi:hypothetical protein
MSNFSAIEVNVPAPWRLVGRLFSLLWFVTFAIYVWLLFFHLVPSETEVAIMAALHFIATPIFVCYFLPVFIDCYPSWFVRLVGRKHLIKIIENFKRHLSKNREEKAHVLLPHAWFRDQRIFWFVLLIGCGILGIFRANNWL